MEKQETIFGVTGDNYKSQNPKYDYSKKIIAYCEHSGKPIREGESYLQTQQGTVLRDDKQVLIEYFNLHRVYEHHGGEYE
jgi:hypothetical protein